MLSPYSHLMRLSRALALVGIACISGAMFVGCSVVGRPADRIDKFVAAGEHCTGSWWIADLREGTSDNARVIAEAALDEAEASAEAVESATNLLAVSMNDYERRNAPAVDFESEAYLLTVTLYVKEQLASAGYPDSDRVLEVRSEHTCS